MNLLQEKLNEEGICFVFAGSVSSLVQGCDIISGDIDILVPQSTDVHKVMHILSEFLIVQPIEPTDSETNIESWLETQSTPFKMFVDFSSNEWTFSRLIVNGIKLEIQLETNMIRNLETRINEIIKVFRSKGYSEELINYALSRGNRKRFRGLYFNY